MRKLIMLVGLFLLISGPVNAMNTVIVSNATTSGTSSTIELKDNEMKQKQLLFEIAGGTVNMTVKVQVRTPIKRSGQTTQYVWADTATYALTGSASSLTYDGDTIPNPFILVTDAYIEALRIVYTITAGSITRVVLTTN